MSPAIEKSKRMNNFKNTENVWVSLENNYISLLICKILNTGPVTDAPMAQCLYTLCIS